MQIISFVFLGFFAVVTAGYYLLPAGVRHIWLFAASMLFYFSQGPAHTVFLLFSILSTWIGGLLLEKAEDSAKKKAILAGILICNLLVLLYRISVGGPPDKSDPAGRHIILSVSVRGLPDRCVSRDDPCGAGSDPLRTVCKLFPDRPVRTDRTGRPSAAAAPEAIL